jgi:hypothetical protein
VPRAVLKSLPAPPRPIPAPAAVPARTFDPAYWLDRVQGPTSARVIPWQAKVSPQRQTTEAEQFKDLCCMLEDLHERHPSVLWVIHMLVGKLWDQHCADQPDKGGA